MAERFAVDYDEDGIYNLDEAPGREYSAGPNTPDSFPRIVYANLQWHTTRVAKINLDTSNYTTVVATATPAFSVADIAAPEPVVGPAFEGVTPGPVDERISISNRFAKTHEIFFKDLAPDTEYEITIQAGNNFPIWGR